MRHRPDPEDFLSGGSWAPDGGLGRRCDRPRDRRLAAAYSKRSAVPTPNTSPPTNAGPATSTGARPPYWGAPTRATPVARPNDRTATNVTNHSRSPIIRENLPVRGAGAGSPLRG